MLVHGHPRLRHARPLLGILQVEVEVEVVVEVVVVEVDVVEEATWLPVSTLCSWAMVAVFHTLMVRSTVPPAVASTPAWPPGDQVIRCLWW